MTVDVIHLSVEGIRCLQDAQPALFTFEVTLSFSLFPLRILTFLFGAVIFLHFGALIKASEVEVAEFGRNPCLH